MFTAYLKNILAFFVFFTIFCFIFGIILKDCQNIEQHIKSCQEFCYPGIVVEQFSRHGCYCQNEVELKYPLDKQ